MKFKILYLCLQIFFYGYSYSLSYPYNNDLIAPISEFNNLKEIFDTYEIDKNITIAKISPFSEDDISLYKKLIRTGIHILEGYSNYPGIHGNYNFLNEKGLNFLNIFKTFEKEINNNTINWKEKRSQFLKIIDKIPRPTPKHNTWNLDLFINVFPNMTIKQIKFLVGYNDNNFTIQLSRTCPNNCLHCAAIAKDRKLSLLEHMPLPIAIKIIEKISQNDEYERYSFSLYDRSDVSSYLDPVLKIDASTIMHFIKKQDFLLSSLSNGNNNQSPLFEHYLPGAISFHPLQMNVLKYIIKKINNPDKDFFEERKQIIYFYLDKFRNATKFLDKFPSSFPFATYEKKYKKPMISFRNYSIKKETKQIISKDKNGAFVLKILNEFIDLQNEIFDIFIIEFQQNKGEIVTINDKNKSFLEFIGFGALLLKNFGMEEKTLMELKKQEAALYNGIDCVIEADGRISFITPEFYKNDDIVPFRKLSDIFKNSKTELFHFFCFALKIISEGKINKKLRTDKDFKSFCSYLNVSHFNIEYMDYNEIYSFDLKKFIDLLNYFFLTDIKLSNALSELSSDNISYIYHTLKDMPIPVNLGIFKKINLTNEDRDEVLDFYLSDEEPELIFRRRAFYFNELGKAFQLVPVNSDSRLNLNILKYSKVETAFSA